ncbi:MAG: TIGR02996 domain-containing protein [Gemmataceae bacterium]
MTPLAKDGPVGCFERALLTSVAAAPDDDLPRLVYADWLDEHGHTDRADFIRVQCELSRSTDPPLLRRALEARAEELWAAHWREWAPILACTPAQEVAVEFRRGFADAVRLTPAAITAYAPRLARELPTITRVAVTDAFPTDANRLRGLSLFPHLTAVDLHLSRLGDDGVSHLARTCQWFARVQGLSLAGNGLTDRGLMRLCRAGHPPTSLKHLDLDANHVTERGVQALADCPAFGGLRSLSLRNNRLGDDAADILARSPYLTQLDDLDLGDTAASSIPTPPGGSGSGPAWSGRQDGLKAHQRSASRLAGR